MPDTRPTFYGLFRESNAVHLEILEGGLAAGVPIEFDVYDRDDLATMLATLEGAREKRYNPMLGDYGSGSFVINRNDPKATDYNLRPGNLVKCRLGGLYRFAWLVEDTDWTEVAQNEKGAEDVKVSGRGAMAYLNNAAMWTESFIGDGPIAGKWDLGAAGTGNARGDMLLRAIDEALARPDGTPLPFLQVGWDYGSDSQGAAWGDTNELAADVGLELGRLWEQLTALGLESEMTPALELRPYVELGRHFEPAPTGNGAVAFLRGRHIQGDWHERRRDARKTRMIVKGAESTTLVVIDPALEAEIGRREGSVSFSNTSDPTTLQRGGEATLASLKGEQEALELPIVHDAGAGGYEPYVDYRLGDWIGVELRDGTLAPHRIVGLRFEEVPNDYALVVQLNSRRVEALVRLKRMIDALGGGGTGGGTSGGSAISGGGSSGSGGGGSSGKVAAAAGDTPGYLYDQLEQGPGIIKELTGAGSAQAVRLSAALQMGQLLDVDLTGITNGQAPIWSAALGLFLPGSGAAGAAASGFLASTKGAPAAIDDEFSSPTLDPKWTLLGGAVAGAVDLLQAADVTRYDLTTRPGQLLLQHGSAATREIQLRQDVMLPDGASIVAAISASQHSTTLTADELQLGVVLNDSDVGFISGNYLALYAVEVDTVPEIQTIQSGGSAAIVTTLGYGTLNAAGKPLFVRIARAGLTYTAWVSGDGTTWLNVGQVTFAAALSNIWIFSRNAGATGTPVPIQAIHWIRQGTNGLDPWPWT